MQPQRVHQLLAIDAEDAGPRRMQPDQSFRREAHRRRDLESQVDALAHRPGEGDVPALRARPMFVCCTKGKVGMSSLHVMRLVNFVWKYVRPSRMRFACAGPVGCSA